MNLNRTPKTEVDQRFKSVQKNLASILGSTVLGLGVSYLSQFEGIFEKHPNVLEWVRIGVAIFALILTCLIGIQSIIWLFGRLIEFKQRYKEVVELEKKQDDE